VDDPERAVAGGNIIDDDAETVNVGELFEGQRLRLHLAEDRIGLLLAPLDPGVQQSVGDQQFAQFVLDLLDQAFIALGELGEPLRDGLVGFRIDVAEGQVFQLVAHVLHAHATGERRIDFHRLFGNAGALVVAHVLERAHIVQAIGQFDQKDTHVVGDRQQQLAQVFRLLGLLRHEVELFQLGQPLDQTADVLAEQFVDFLPRRGGILDRVVQQRHRDGRLVEMHVGQDGGDFERVGNVRVATGTRLLAMLLHGIDIGFVEQSFVGIGLVFLNPLDELVLPHHAQVLHKRKARQSTGIGAQRRVSETLKPYCLTISNRRSFPAEQALRYRPEDLLPTSGRS